MDGYLRCSCICCGHQRTRICWRVSDDNIAVDRYSNCMCFFKIHFSRSLLQKQNFVSNACLLHSAALSPSLLPPPTSHAFRSTLPRYTLMEFGTCPKPYQFIDTWGDCSEAARALNLEDKTASKIPERYLTNSPPNHFVLVWLAEDTDGVHRPLHAPRFTQKFFINEEKKTLCFLNYLCSVAS